MKRPSNNKPPIADGDHWYQQPVAWLGLGISILMLSVGIATIVISFRYEPVRLGSSSLLGMPATPGVMESSQNKQ